MCNISFCDVDSKVDQFFQPTLYIIVMVLGLPTNCLALWAAYMQVRSSDPLHRCIPPSCLPCPALPGEAA